MFEASIACAQYTRTAISRTRTTYGYLSLTVNYPLQLPILSGTYPFQLPIPSFALALQFTCREMFRNSEVCTATSVDIMK